MKKALKTFILLFVAIITLGASGCSCFNRQETYSKYGMSITMDKGFVEKSIVTATYYLESTDAIMLATKEEFQSLIPSTMSLESYTDLVLDTNDLTADVDDRETKDYLYFSYKKTVNGKDFYYFATTHKTDDAFWLVQFACVEDDKDEFQNKFFTWADTITFQAQ